MNSFVANQRIFYSLHVYLIKDIFVTTAVKSENNDKVSSNTIFWVTGAILLFKKLSKCQMCLKSLIEFKFFFLIISIPLC